MPAGGTPTTVPARFGLSPGAPGPCIGRGAVGAGAGAPGAWFISIVPLNFGAAAPLRLKPHFVHVDAVSEFCVPQFGQNTQHLRQRSPGASPRQCRSRSARQGNGRIDGSTRERVALVVTGRGPWKNAAGRQDRRGRARTAFTTRARGTLRPRRPA